MLFVHESERSIDGNGRVALPSAYRDRLEGECYMRVHPDGYLTFHPAAEVAAEAEALRDQLRAGALSDADHRAIGASTRRLAVDKQGRITLDQDARTPAGIRTDSEVVVNGRHFFFEIWSPVRYRHIVAEQQHARPGRSWEGIDDA